MQDERTVTKGEVLAMTLAKAAGLDVAAGRIAEGGGVAVALIRRLMQVSAATLLGGESAGAHERSYAEIMDELRVNRAAAQSDNDEPRRRMAFSILITDVDDHLHNHGFLHAERGLWRPAPAFDLSPFRIARGS